MSAGALRPGPGSPVTPTTSLFINGEERPHENRLDEAQGGEGGILDLCTDIWRVFSWLRVVINSRQLFDPELDLTCGKDLEIIE